MTAFLSGLIEIDDGELVNRSEGVPIKASEMQQPVAFSGSTPSTKHCAMSLSQLWHNVSSFYGLSIDARARSHSINFILESLGNVR